MGRVRNRSRNAAQRMKGRVKVAVGRATGRRRLRAHGRIDQGTAAAKQAAERIKDHMR